MGEREEKGGGRGGGVIGLMGEGIGLRYSRRGVSCWRDRGDKQAGGVDPARAFGQTGVIHRIRNGCWAGRGLGPASQKGQDALPLCLMSTRSPFSDPSTPAKSDSGSSELYNSFPRIDTLPQPGTRLSAEEHKLC